MVLNVNAPELALDRGQVLTLDDAAGTCIHARTGQVWITEEGSVKDNVLGPGEVFVVGHAGRTVVQAMKPAWVSLTDCARPANDAAWPSNVANHEDAIAEMRDRILTRYY